MRDKIKMYIEGFDELLKGGIPQGHIVLIRGGPGTFKSSITLNTLSNNAELDGKKALYLSLEESKESLEATAKGLGLKEWDEENFLIADVSKIRLEHNDTEDTHNWIKIVEKYIHRRVEDGFELIALDSMSALYSLMEFKNPRKELFKFFGVLKKLNINVFLITESWEEAGKSDMYGEDFLSDGIIYLKYHHISETEIQLWIRCVKMRQVDHTKNYYALLHEGNHFQIARVISERR
ncbi:MAG: ATPase domain-containing protein [Thermoplasmata archaeon]